MDHFERFGLGRSARIDLDELERRYLRKSREVHPDLNDDEAAIVESAALNKAYRVLRDPWQRYAYLAELYCPGVMDANKRLCPTFLAEAMELHERAVEAQQSERARVELETRVADELARFTDRIEAALESEAGARDAAVLCHQARYLQRTLETLQDTEEPLHPPR